MTGSVVCGSEAGSSLEPDAGRGAAGTRPADYASCPHAYMRRSGYEMHEQLV